MRPGLTLAALDPNDTLCIEALRGIDEATLYRLHTTWKEVQSILGNRALQLIDLEQVTAQVRSEEFLRDASYPWMWQRLQPVASEIIPLLNAHLNSPEQDIRIAAIHALQKLGTGYDLTAPLLLECLNDESVIVQITAIDALSSVGIRAQYAIPQLQRFLKSDYLSVKIAAEDAITTIEQAVLK